jgi:hypothetical protein
MHFPLSLKGAISVKQYEKYMFLYPVIKYLKTMHVKSVLRRPTFQWSEPDLECY